MSLRAQLLDDLNRAMKDASENGKRRLPVLRWLLAAVKNEEIALKVREQGLSDEQMIAVVRREVKRRREAAQVYRSHREEARAMQEEFEAGILETYLPQAPDADTLRTTITEIVAALPESQRNIGAVMKEAMAKFRGSVDGQMARTVAEEALAGKS